MSACVTLRSELCQFAFEIGRGGLYALPEDVT
jgi:hypothetical protein